jgi:hypothetical protein
VALQPKDRAAIPGTRFLELLNDCRFVIVGIENCSTFPAEEERAYERPSIESSGAGIGNSLPIRFAPLVTSLVTTLLHLCGFREESQNLVYAHGCRGLRPVLGCETLMGVPTPLPLAVWVCMSALRWPGQPGDCET